MKANELMTGDYVRYKRTKEIIWVFEIDSDRDVINNEPDGYCSEKNIEINNIEPIPLTLEILEKNGFRLHNSASYFKEYMWTTGGVDDYADVYIEVGQDQQDNWRWDCLHIKLKFCGGEAFFRKKHYVHELQHILRMCGPNELADNFKI